jgi:hypothetical protein
MPSNLKPSVKLFKSNWRTMKLDGKDNMYKLVVDSDSNGYEMLFFDFDDFKMYYLRQNNEEIQKLFNV